MSAPVAGKFQDHYIVLELEPKASSENIQQSYARLARKYHPNTPDTGDRDKFEAVNLAYEVLSDPGLRREFDKLKGLDQEKGAPKFNGPEFFEALGRATSLRVALLCVLYDRRRAKPVSPGLSLRHTEGMIQATPEELTFVLWYLKQRGLVSSDDKSNLQITVEGMDLLESLRPSPEAVLPFINPAALAHPLEPEMATAAAAASSDAISSESAAPPAGTTPVLKALQHALSRR